MKWEQITSTYSCIINYPFSMFDSKAQLRQSWMYMTTLKQSKFVKRVGVSNFHASHLTKLFDVCQEFNLEKPFANEVQINPYVYCLVPRPGHKKVPRSGHKNLPRGLKKVLRPGHKNLPRSGHCPVQIVCI